MSRLLETIRIENGRPQHLAYHTRRAREARRQLLGLEDAFDLERYIKIPEELGDGLYKCRVTYGAAVESVEFEPYTVRPVHSLRLVRDDNIDYRFKYADRRRLQVLFARRGDCDDVLIVKRGLLTDTSYCNIAVYDGLQWWTPDAPLLPGTARQRLLDKGLIREKRIRVEDLPLFKRIRLINAMLPWEGKGLVVERLES